jgi:hypothetical protein
MTQPIFGAAANISIETSSTVRDPMSTGRRPTKSESDPATTSAATRAIAYDANAIVNRPAGNPHCCW